MPSNILLFYPIGPSDQMTGGHVSTLNLVSGLHKKGLSVTFMSQRESKLSKAIRDEGVSVEILPLPDILDTYGKQVLDFGPLNKTKASLALIKYNLDVLRLISEDDISVVWARSVKGILLTGFSSLWSGRSLVWDIGLEQKTNGWMRVLHFLALCLSTKVVTQARRQPADIFGSVFSRSFKSKFHPIYPGIAEERASKLQQASTSQGASERKRILSIGSIHPRKNQRMLIEAFSRLHTDGVDVEVLFAGPIRDEEYFQELSSFVKSKGIAKDIEFLGWRDDIPQLLAKSDVMVLTSRQEGVPHVVREAMFAQVPVVATAVGGVPEAVENGKTGFLVGLDDVRALRKCLRRLLKSPDERKEMGRAGLELAQERFSRESWLSEYYNLLQDLT